MNKLRVVSTKIFETRSRHLGFLILSIGSKATSGQFKAISVIIFGILAERVCFKKLKYLFYGSQLLEV
ncbi:MAG: hypothetical protein CML40_06560 [Rhodobacteraceae bacterium]|nr:MAG: hypothetical protein CML40_06560 [Paracoccaceae bacterium]